jgi:DNA (cytosine-5)-methyltransferase 1
MVVYRCKTCEKKFNKKEYYTEHHKIDHDNVDRHKNDKNSTHKKKKKVKKIIKKTKKNKDIKLKMIDLCAGTGAFTYAFEKTGHVDVVFANDYEETSKIIYDINFDHKLVHGNICDINVSDIPHHDILTAGFPCQPFSIAGKRQGFEDTRSNVFWKIMEIIKHHEPECVILENVKNLTTHDNGNTFKIIQEQLTKEYNIVYNMLDTSQITCIPQHRERLYIVCIKDDNIFNKFDLDFDSVQNKSIRDMLLEDIDDKYYYNDEDNKIHKQIMDAVINHESVYQYRRVYVRENKNKECPTLTANMGTGGHNVPIILDNKGARKLTPRECFNFQGFPPDYVLPLLSNSKLYKLAGNAVSLSVVTLIADRLVPELYQWLQLKN